MQIPSNESPRILLSGPNSDLFFKLQVVVAVLAATASAIVPPEFKSTEDNDKVRRILFITSEIETR